jgi:hypothetical protein
VAAGGSGVDGVERIDSVAGVTDALGDGAEGEGSGGDATSGDATGGDATGSDGGFGAAAHPTRRTTSADPTRRIGPSYPRWPNARRHAFEGTDNPSIPA